MEQANWRQALENLDKVAATVATSRDVHNQIAGWVKTIGDHCVAYDRHLAQDAQAGSQEAEPEAEGTTD